MDVNVDNNTVTSLKRLTQVKGQPPLKGYTLQRQTLVYFEVIKFELRQSIFKMQMTVLKKFSTVFVFLSLSISSPQGIYRII